MASLDGAGVELLSYACADGKYRSVGAQHPPALRLERAIHSLFGLEAVGSPDTRPWLDLGFWDVRIRPPTAPAPKPKPYALSSRPKARACIRFRSGRCMPASSSRAISASPPMASTWCGWSSGSAMCTRASKADGGRDARSRRQARRPHVGRQHGRLFLCLCAGRRGRLAGHRAAACALLARADGGAGAAGQSFRRHRRHLQRRRFRSDACADEHPARAGSARGRGLLRPPADDGPDRARRRRARHRGRWRRRRCARCWRKRAKFSRA